MVHLSYPVLLLALVVFLSAVVPGGRCQPPAVTVAVDPNSGNNTLSCNTTSPCRTIAFALQKRNATTVALAGAVFTESTVVVTAPQTAVTVLGAADGSTIFNCESRPGPAFQFFNSSVAIFGVTFLRCTNLDPISSFQGLGGAVLAVNCTVAVSGCTFTGNSAVSGGALAVVSSNLVLSSSTFSFNSAIATCINTLLCAAWGGAVFASESNSIQVLNCVLSSNMVIVNGSGTSMVAGGGCISVSFANDAISATISAVGNTFSQCTVTASNANASDYVRARVTGGSLAILFAWRAAISRTASINYVSSLIQNNSFAQSSASFSSVSPEYFSEATGGCVSIRIGSLMDDYDSNIVSSATSHSIFQNTFTNCSSVGSSLAAISTAYSPSISVSRIFGGSLSLFYGSSGAFGSIGSSGLKLNSIAFNFSNNVVQNSLAAWSSPLNENTAGCFGGGVSVFYGDSRFQVATQNGSVVSVLFNASVLLQRTSDLISNNRFINCQASSRMRGAQTASVSGGGLSLIYGHHLWSSGSATLYSVLSVLDSSVQVSGNKLVNCSAGISVSGSFGTYGVSVQGGAIALAFGSSLNSWTSVGVTKSEILLSNHAQSLSSNDIISASATSVSQGSGVCSQAQVLGGAMSVRIGTTNFGQTLSSAVEAVSVLSSNFVFDNNSFSNSFARADLIGPAGLGTTAFGGAISWFLGLNQFTAVTSSTSTITFVSSQTAIVVSNNQILRASAQVVSVGNGGTLFFVAAGGGVSIEIGPFVTGSAAGNYVNDVVNVTGFNLSAVSNSFQDCLANSTTSGPGSGSSAASVYGGALSIHVGGWAFGDAGLTLWNTLVGLFIPRDNRVTASYFSISRNIMQNCVAATSSVGDFNGGASGSSAYGGCTSLFFGAHSITTRSGENSTYIRFMTSTTVVTSDNVMNGCQAITRVAGGQNGGLWGCQARGGALAIQLGPILYVLKGLPNSNGFLNGIFLDLPNQVGGGSSGLISLTGVVFNISRNSFANCLALVNNTEFFSFGSGSFSTGGGLNFLIGTEVIVEFKRSGFNDILSFGTTSINIIGNNISGCSATSNLSNSNRVIDFFADPVQTISSGGGANVVLGSTLMVQQSVTNGIAANLGVPMKILQCAIRITDNAFVNCNATSSSSVSSTFDITSNPSSFTASADVFGGSVALSIGHLNLARRVRIFELSPAFSVNGTCQAVFSTPSCSVPTTQCAVPDYLPQYTNCFVCTLAGNVWISNIASQYPGLGQCVFPQYATDTFFPSGLLLPTSNWKGIMNMSDCPGVYSAPFANQTLQLVDTESKTCPICTFDTGGIRRQWCVTLSLCLPYSISCPITPGVASIFDANGCFDKKNARYFPTCLSCVGQNGNTASTAVLQWCNSSINGPCQRIGSPCDGPVSVQSSDCAGADVNRSNFVVNALDCFSCVKQTGFWLTGIGNLPYQGEPNAGACFSTVNTASILGSNNFIVVQTIENCPGVQWPNDITSCVRCVGSSFKWCLASASCVLRSLPCPNSTDIGVTTSEICFTPRTASYMPSCSSCLNENSIAVRTLQWCASVVPIGSAQVKGNSVLDLEISINQNIFSNSSVVASSSGSTRSLHAYGGGVFLGIGNKVYSDSAVAATIGYIDLGSSKMSVTSNVFMSSAAVASSSSISTAPDDVASYGGGFASHFNSIVSGFAGNLTDPLFELLSQGSSLNFGANSFHQCYVTTTSSQCIARAAAVGGALFVSPPPTSTTSMWSLSIIDSQFYNNSASLNCLSNQFGFGISVSGGAMAVSSDSYSASIIAPYSLKVFNCSFKNSFPIVSPQSAMIEFFQVPCMVLFVSVSLADISFSVFEIFGGINAASTTALYVSGSSLIFTSSRFERKTAPTFPARDPAIFTNVASVSFTSSNVQQDESIVFGNNNTVVRLSNSGRIMQLVVVDSVFNYSGPTQLQSDILTAPTQTIFTSSNSSLYCTQSVAVVTNDSTATAMSFQCSNCDAGNFAYYGSGANLSNAQAYLNKGKSLTSSTFCSPSSQSGSGVCPFGSSTCQNYVAVTDGFWAEFIENSTSNSFKLISPQRCPRSFCSCDPSTGSRSCDLNPPIAVGVANNQDHLCAPNRTGTLCGSCKSGFTAALDGFSCVANDVCATTVGGVWSLALFTYLIYGLFIALTSGQEADGVVEVFLYFQQISALTVTPPLTETASDFQNFVENVQRTCGFVSPGQILKSSCLGPNMSNLDLLVTLTFVPVTLVTIFTFFWIQMMLIAHKYHRKLKLTVVARGKGIKAIRIFGSWLRPTRSGAAIQLIFYAFTSLVTATFQATDCVNMGDELGSRFLYDGNRPCYDGLWSGMITFVCLLALVPVAFLGYFFKYRREIMKHDSLPKILQHEGNLESASPPDVTVLPLYSQDQHIHPLGPQIVQDLQDEPKAGAAADTAKFHEVRPLVKVHHALHSSQSVPVRREQHRTFQNLRRVFSEKLNRQSRRISALVEKTLTTISKAVSNMSFMEKLHSKVYVIACHQFTPFCAWWNALALFYRFLAVGSSVVNPPPMASFLLMMINMLMLLVTAVMRPYRSEFAQKLDVTCKAILVIQFAVSLFVQQPEMIGVPNDILFSSPYAVPLIENLSTARNSFSLLPILALCFYYGRQVMPTLVEYWRNRKNPARESTQTTGTELDDLRGLTLDNEQGDFDRAKYDQEYRANMISFAPASIANFQSAAQSTSQTSSFSQSISTVDVSKRSLISHHHITHVSSAHLPPRKHHEDLAVVPEH